jgi:Acetyltransferase (GNAT) domain
VKLIIDSVSPASDSEWQQTWEACESATYFHSPEWARIWSEYSGGRVRPTPQLVKFSDGARVVLPLSHETKLAGLLNRVVCSPQGTYGGWLNASPLTMSHALLLVDWLTRQQRSSLVWRLNPYDPLCFKAGVIQNVQVKSDETHAIRLDKSPDEILKGFKTTYRSQIRKAVQSGQFSVEQATTLADWRAYFEVYQDSLQRWGNKSEDGYAWRLFEGMFKLQSPNVRLWLARHEGRIISGDLCLYSPKHVAYWHGSTLKDYLRTAVSKLLKFEVIKDAHSRGHAWYDLNPSAGLEGVKFFKEGFNAEVLPAPVVYVDTTFKRVIRTCAVSVQLQYAELALKPLVDVMNGLQPPV